MSAPKLVLIIELERGAWGFLDVVNEGEERRLLFDLADRDLQRELLHALRELLRLEDAA